MKTSVFLFLSLFVIISLSADSCRGTPNKQDVYTKPPTFIKNVTLGENAGGRLSKTYATETPVSILELYGTPYEIGKAHGLLLKDEIKQLIPAVQQYFYDEIDKQIQFLPKFIREFIEEYGSAAALYLTYEFTRSYTPDYWYEELQGLADGSGVDYNALLEIHMLPELIKAACSIIGAWGQATNETSTPGSLVQVRALDWIMDGPFQEVPSVIVYHPTEGHPFSVVTWAGFIGTVSGMSSVPLGICEKVWLSYQGKSTRFGYPWHFLLRDILQFDNTVDDAIQRIQNADRTCSIHVGVGGVENKFRVIEYSYETATVYDDTNYPVYQGHPRFKNVVYVDKHVQPSHNPCLANLIQENYNKLDALNMIQHVTAELQTGNTHIAVYDYGNMHMYVSNAAPVDKGNAPAYDRAFTRLDMKKLFDATL